jgi:chromosomal replication initiator protein
MQKQKSFADFVVAPGNRAALAAVQDTTAAVQAGHLAELPNPLFLHGPSGTGKSHLVRALIREVTHRSPAIVNVLESGSLGRVYSETEHDETFAHARDCDLLAVEDLQYLPACWWQVLVQLLDHRLAHGQAVLLTASVGPQHLACRGEQFPNRLVSRLAAGLVVGLQPLQARGRRLLLEHQAGRRHLRLSEDVLSWLAEHLSGARQLEGAMNQLQELACRRSLPLDVDVVSRHMRDQAEAGRPTVERIALRVSGYFRVEARQLQSRRRYRNVLLPRQIGMYLARQLTGLSLEQIGAYFGGRDHTTVLHACRKVAECLTDDATLSGAVQQIRAGLT